MPKEEVVPMCRYGHGEMVRANTPYKPNLFIAPMITDDPIISISPNGGYLFAVYECQVCTYIELHDKEL